MILECVVRQCEEKWRRLGWGFWLDWEKWASATCADVIFLISATKRDLESMIGEVVLELQRVGLGLGANKTHWSSYLAKRGETLRVDEELILRGTCTDLCWYGTRPGRIILGSHATQTGPRTSDTFCTANDEERLFTALKQWRLGRIQRAVSGLM